MEKGSIGGLIHKEMCTKSGEKLSLSAVLTEKGLFRDLFVHHEIIPPQRKASNPHSRSHKEEMVFVLSGKVRAHVGDSYLDLKEGEYVSFAAGGEKHFLENTSELEAKCLVICSNPEKDEVSYG